MHKGEQALLRKAETHNTRATVVNVSMCVCVCVRKAGKKVVGDITDTEMDI